MEEQTVIMVDAGGGVAAPADGVYNEAATLDFLAERGIATVPRALCHDANEVVTSATSMGYPVVLKSAHDSLIHKSELGAVFTDLRSTAEVSTAWTTLQDRGLADVVLVEKYLRGVECLVGLKADAELGRSLVVGVGGVYVEIMGAPLVEMLPVRREELRARLLDSPLGKLLTGYRGTQMLAVDKLVDLAVQAATLFASMPELVELEMNPVIVGSDFAIPVDARMRVDDSGVAAVARPRGSNDFTRLLNPAAVAVVGASDNPAKPGGRVLANLVRHGFPGMIYVVNPSRDTVQGITAHATVDDLPAAAIDLACVAVPPADVTSVIAACEGRGIPHAVVLSGGADESLARHLSNGSATTRVYGPNSLGVVSPPSRLFASFAGMLALPLDRHGTGGPGVAFVSQSGAIASALGSRLVADGVNVTRWFSTGNEVDVDLAEVLDHLADDEMTRMILVYIEGIRRGQAFIDAATRCRDNGKQIIAYKSGTSDSGRQAIISHTGAIAGADRLYDAIFRRSGVIRVDTLQHLLDAGRLVGLAGQGGDRIGVITMSGGAAAIIADQCDRRGLRLSRFSERTAGILGQLIPAYGSATNPIDLTADAVLAPDDVANAVRAVMDDDDVDIVACQFTTNADPTASTMAAALVRLVESGPKPLIIGRLGAEALAPEAVRVYHEAGVPVFDTPERLVDAAWILSNAGPG